MTNNYIVEKIDEATTIGIHGTSVEAAAIALKEGKFKPEYFTETTRGKKSDSLHFIANMNYFGEYFRSISERFHKNWSCNFISCGEMWAEDLAFRHFMAIQTRDTKRLGWEVIKWEAQERNCPPRFDFSYDELSEWGWGPEFSEHLKREKISEDSFSELLRQGVGRKGCLIGLNERCKSLKVTYGDLDVHPEAKLITPDEGLTLDYITGIVPLGEVEKKILLASK